MARTAAQRLHAEKIRAETRDDPRLVTIRRCQEELRLWDIHAGDRIWPLTPVTRKMFEEGITVFAYLRPAMPSPNEYAWALAEFCACYRHGLIVVGPCFPAEVCQK